MQTGTHDTGAFPRSSTTASDAVGEMKEKASELTRTARERAVSALDERRSELGSLLERLADTMQDDRLGGYAAEYARRGAEFLRRSSAEDVLLALRRGIRDRPGLMLSACFVAGLAIARAVKGSGSARGEERRHGLREEWSPEDELRAQWRRDEWTGERP